MNSDIDVTYGISPDYMKESEFSNAARITSSGTKTNAISAGSNVDAGNSESVNVYEGELTINELEEAATDSTDEEVIDVNDIDWNAGCPGLRRRRFDTRDYISSSSQENEEFHALTFTR